MEIRLDDRSSRNRKATLRFCILYGDKQPAENVYAERRRFWKMDRVLRIKTNLVNATFEKSEMRATMSNIEINNTKDMRITCVMNRNETTLALN